MKFFSITLLFVFTLITKGYCLNHDSTKLSVKRLSVNIKLIKEYIDHFDIEISLKNNSGSSDSLWLMTCSWEENFLINNTYISFVGKKCSKNIPTIKEIKAGDCLVLQTSLKRANRRDTSCKGCAEQMSNVPVTKIGLVYIDTKQCHDFEEYFKIMQDKSAWSKIIWSNALYLNI